MKIIVCDNNAEFAEALKIYITNECIKSARYDESFRIESFSSAAEAANYIEAYNADILFLDISMPETDLPSRIFL